MLLISRMSSALLLSVHHISAPPCGEPPFPAGSTLIQHPPARPVFLAPLPTPPCFQPVNNILGQAVWIYLCQARLPGQEQPESQEANPDVGWNVSRAFWCPCGQSAEEGGEEKLLSQLKEKGEPEGPGNRRVLFPVSLAQQSLCKFSYVLFGPAANQLAS